MKWWAPVFLVVLLSGCANRNRVVLGGGGPAAPASSGTGSVAAHPTAPVFGSANSATASHAPGSPSAILVVPTPRPLVPEGAVAAPGLLAPTPAPLAASRTSATPAGAVAGGGVISNSPAAAPVPSLAPAAPATGPAVDPNQVMRNAQGQVIPPASATAPAPVFGTNDPVLRRSAAQQDGLSLDPPGFAAQVDRLFGAIKGAASPEDASRIAADAGNLRVTYGDTASIAAPARRSAYGQGQSAMANVIAAANTESAFLAGQLSSDDASTAIANDKIAAAAAAQTGDQIFTGQ